jgi:hypothetical protein
LFKLDVISSLLTATDGVERFNPKVWIVVDDKQPVAEYEKQFSAAWTDAVQKTLGFQYDGTVDYGKATSVIGISKENVWRKVKAEGCDDTTPCIARTESSYFQDVKNGSVGTRELAQASWMPGTGLQIVEARDDQFPNGYVKLAPGCVPDAFKAFRLVTGCERNTGRFITRKDLADLSAALPSYVWIWSPIDRTDSHVAPMLLNQGVGYYFVKPQGAPQASATPTVVPTPEQQAGTASGAHNDGHGS